MGLDMYLMAQKYVGGWNYSNEDEKKAFTKILKAISIKSGDVASDSPSITVNVTVMYWRKANAIHRWFVKNTQDGKDECKESYVSREQLAKLVKGCDTALENEGKEAANYADLKETSVRLKSILDNPRLKDCEFYYRASW